MDYNNQYKLAKAFKKLFLDKGQLKPEGKIVLSFIRDFVHAKGELGENGSSFVYDQNGRFDGEAAAFLLGKQQVFNQMIKYLSIDEMEIFKLISLEEERLKDMELIATNLNI